MEIAFPSGAAIDAKAELKLALEALRRQGVVQEDNRLLAQTSLVMDPAYVHIRPDTESLVRSVR